MGMWSIRLKTQMEYSSSSGGSRTAAACGHRNDMAPAWGTVPQFKGIMEHLLYPEGLWSVGQPYRPVHVEQWPEVTAWTRVNVARRRLNSSSKIRQTQKRRIRGSVMRGKRTRTAADAMWVSCVCWCR